MIVPDSSSNADHTTIEISDPSQLPETPLISIYMLAYRHERFIAKAIEGVMSQQCNFPIELIIGEDCSPDRTQEIAINYQKKYPQTIRLITSKKNVGAHANSARCRAACRGEFIAICEGDDYWHNPAKLQLQLDLMLASPHTTMCHTDYHRQIGSRIKRSRNQSGTGCPALSYLDALHGKTVKTATCLYRKDVLNNFSKSPFYNISWPFGDHNLELFAAISGHISYIPESTATSRKVMGSATNSGDIAALRMATAALECRELFMDTFPVPSNDMESVRRASYERIMQCSFLAGDQKGFLCAAENFSAHGGSISHIKFLTLNCFLQLGFPVHAYRAFRNAVLWITAG